MVGVTTARLGKDIKKKKKEKVKAVPKVETPRADTRIPVTGEGGSKGISVITNEDGKEVGFEKAGGVFLGQTEADITKEVRAKQQKGEPIIGDAARRLQKERADLTETAKLIIDKFKNGQSVSAEELANLSASELSHIQALGKGVAVAGPGVVGGAIAGGVGGAAATVPLGGVGAIPGALGGAALGAIGGFIGGVASSYISQQSGNLATRVTDIERLRTEMQTSITNIKSGGDPMTNTEDFFEGAAIMARSYGELKLDTATGKILFTGKDGANELRKHELFETVTLPRMERELEQALANPTTGEVVIAEQ